MPQRSRLITVLKLLLFQTALKVNQAAAEVRENHVNGILGESVLLHIEQASTASVQRITWEKGDSAFLTCENNGCKVYGQNERMQCFPDCSLKLSGLLSSDGGTYRACVTSDIGQIQTQVTYLNVLVPVSLPTIGVHRHNWTGHNNLTLTCSVTEGSSPRYFWEKEDQPLTDSLRYTLMNGNSSISIQPFTAADCGSYTCTVRNSISKHKFRRTLVGDDSSECATSDYLFPVIALATCLVAFSVFLILFKRRVACCKGGP